jgi:hypothetical protein
MPLFCPTSQTVSLKHARLPALAAQKYEIAVDRAMLGLPAN